MKNRFAIFFNSVLILALVTAMSSGCTRTKEFYKVTDGHITLAGVPQYYIGTNVWYAPRLAIEDPDRLVAELDTLHALGLDNLRIKATDENFEGLDIVFEKMRERGMSAVLYLNNSWEWTEDAYYSYLERAGAGVQPLPKTEGYTAFMNAMSAFASNEKAVSLYQEHVKRIVSRYKDEPAVFSWQICNEPRPFADDSTTRADFIRYIQGTAELIKSIDHNHMVSTGNEGSMGCEADIELFEKVHDCPSIDYLTIHIWPYNWSWIESADVNGGVPAAISKTGEYINSHLRTARALGKPVVIEEFGYPRDGFAYENTSTTTGRDEYYSFIFKNIFDNATSGGLLAGCNFWAWSGYARQTEGHQFWEEGDDLCGDPFQEAQGLNSVYLTDESTVGIVGRYTRALEDAVSVYSSTSLSNRLFTGNGPFNLAVEVSSRSQFDGNVKVDFIRDISLMSDIKDTVLSFSVPVKGEAGTYPLAFDITSLSPGFYQAVVTCTPVSPDSPDRSLPNDGQTLQDDKQAIKDNEQKPQQSRESAAYAPSVQKFNIGINPELVESPQDKRPDFDSFWSTTLDELASVPMDAKLTLIPEKSDSHRNLYRVEVNSLGGEIMGGYYCEPTGEGKYPAIIEYMGYGADPFTYDPSSRPDAVQFLVSVRDQGIFRTEEHDWIDRSLSDKEKFYYRGAFADVVRAIDFIWSRDKVDTARVVAVGESQGGAFTWIAGSLDHRLKAIAPAVPFLSDYPDYSTIVWWPMQEVFAAAEKQNVSRDSLFTMLSYFDIKNFTDRVSCPVYMSFGLQDPVCPPHTNFAGYNMVPGPKRYHCVTTCGHEMWREKSWTKVRSDFLDSFLTPEK